MLVMVLERMIRMVAVEGVVLFHEAALIHTSNLTKEIRVCILNQPPFS